LFSTAVPADADGHAGKAGMAFNGIASDASAVRPASGVASDALAAAG
jgi:hypothetical protein